MFPKNPTLNTFFSCIKIDHLLRQKFKNGTNNSFLCREMAFFTLTVYISGSGTCYLNDGTFSESPKEEEETVLEEITRKASIGRY